MARVTGIGGIFFKARDPQALAAWYRDRLGLDLQDWGGAVFAWGGDGSPAGSTLWSAFPEDSDNFQPGTGRFMVNFRVDDLDGLLAALRAAGCTAEGGGPSEYGRFGWVVDPEGNKVELWEPPAGQ